MKQVNHIKLFISCPGNMREEVNSIQLIIEEINKTTGKQYSYVLESLNWNVDTYTQVKDEPQAVINEQIDYDILIGLIGDRIGTPTKKYKSGTVEEISLAIENNKQLLVYFRTSPPESLNSIDVKQLNKVNLFKKGLGKKGLLYKEYGSIKNFESLFRININNLIEEKILNKNSISETNLTLSPTEKYTDIATLLDAVEKGSTNSFDFDIFFLTEETTSSLEKITYSTNSITSSVTDLSGKLNTRTKELNNNNNIKDDRLRNSRAMVIMNLLASDLDDFNSRIFQELPVLSENFSLVGPNYAKLFTFSKNLINLDELKGSALSLRNSVHGSIQEGVEFLKIILAWPAVNSKFNESKRQTEIVLKDLMKEMLEGLKLLDEAIKI